MIKKKLYTAQAKSSGGRMGKITSENGALEVAVSVQNTGDATNPEQLFAAGYAACFESTIQVMASTNGIKIGETSVNGLVDLGTVEVGNYEIAIKLEVSLPGLSEEDAQKLIRLAHENCPYSKATRNNIEVEIVLV